MPQLLSRRKLKQFKLEKVSTVNHVILFFRRSIKMQSVFLDCPVAPTKWKYVEGQKIKKAISRNVNKKVEEEIRATVSDAPKVYLAKKKKQIKQIAEPKPKQTGSSSTS